MIKLNKILCRDSKSALQKIDSESIDLCYLDPPFFTNRVFQIKDQKGKEQTFSDIWANGETYLKYILDIASECHRVLNSKGSLYIQCDWHASHYLKVGLDKIFGRKNFRNEIIWKRHNSHNDTKQGSKNFGRVHDVIFFYTKSSQYTWNPIFAPYSEEYVKRAYRHTELGTDRKYALGDLSGPGGSSKGNPYFEFLGVSKFWRYNKSKMQKLFKEGRIIQNSPGTVPLYKRYLDEMPGVLLQDIWNDVKSVKITKNEITEYPTQKPERLLERIIQISSNPKDTVLDPFCGSGTTLVSAFNLDRKYIGFDINPEACAISRKRIKKRANSLYKNKKSMEQETIIPVFP